MKREQKWEFKYETISSDGSKLVKSLVVKSKEKIDDLKSQCKKAGYRVVSVKKLYPFSTEKNQHNFMLVDNICKNTMYDMVNGVIPYDNDEYIRLEELHQKAQKYFCYDLPVAWVTWDEHQEMKELSIMAINRRMDTCEKHGRLDLIKYC